MVGPVQTLPIGPDGVSLMPALHARRRTFSSRSSPEHRRPELFFGLFEQPLALGQSYFCSEATTDARRGARHAKKTNKFFFASFAPLRENCLLLRLLNVGRLRASATPRRLFLDRAATTLSPKSRARVLPHQHGNLRRLDPRQEIAVQVRVPAELTPTRLTHVIPTGVL